MVIYLPCFLVGGVTRSFSSQSITLSRVNEKVVGVEIEGGEGGQRGKSEKVKTRFGAAGTDSTKHILDRCG